MAVSDVERIARAMCVAGGGDPDRLLSGVIRGITGDTQHDADGGIDPRTGKPVRFYKFWRCFQTEARAAIAEIIRQPSEALLTACLGYPICRPIGGEHENL